MQTRYACAKYFSIDAREIEKNTRTRKIETKKKQHKKSNATQNSVYKKISFRALDVNRKIVYNLFDLAMADDCCRRHGILFA